MSETPIGARSDFSNFRVDADYLTLQCYKWWTTITNTTLYSIAASCSIIMTFEGPTMNREHSWVVEPLAYLDIGHACLRLEPLAKACLSTDR